MFNSIEQRPNSKDIDGTKRHFFPDNWADDDDCDNDEGWRKEWDDFDLNTPQEDEDKREDF